MSEVIFVAQDAPEGGYTARALEYPIFTEGDTFEQLGRAVIEAVLCHFDNGTAPRFVRCTTSTKTFFPSTRMRLPLEAAA